MVAFHGIQNREHTWHCICDCGRHSVLPGGRLRSGNTRSCGCIARERIAEVGRSRAGIIGHNLIDRTGQKYGKLTVLERVPSRGNVASWRCVCDCGQETVVDTNTLRRQSARSCGCARRTGKGSRRSYRCQTPPGISARNLVLKQYIGGARARGLSWNLSNEQFFSITQQCCFYCGVGPLRVRKPSKNGEFRWNGIDRIDNTIGYEPTNVRPCCSICNHAKRDMTTDAFAEWIDRLVAHHSSSAIGGAPHPRKKR